MKHFFIILFCIVCTAFSISAQNTFKELGNTKGVEIVYISEAMINMTGNHAIKGIPMSSSAKTRVKDMEIYSAETKTASQAVAQAYANYKKSHPDLQILVKIKNDSEITEITATPTSIPNVYSTLLIYNSDMSDINIIVINGRFSNDDIASMSRGRY